jgi:hypothetical protein
MAESNLPIHARWQRRRLAGFHGEQPPSLVAANVIASQRTTVGTDVSMSGGRFRRKRRRRLGEQEKSFNTEERSKRRNGGEEKGISRMPLFFTSLFTSSQDLHVPELKKDLLRQTHAARGKRRNRKTQEQVVLRYLRSSVLNGFCIGLSLCCPAQLKLERHL